jgi:hypothetical protein
MPYKPRGEMSPKELEEARAKDRIASKKKYDKIKTGYPRGRPRQGELRPPSAGAIAIAKYRKDHLEEQREYNRIKQAEWRANNRDRSNEISRNTAIRKKRIKEYIETLKGIGNVQFFPYK